MEYKIKTTLYQKRKPCIASRVADWVELTWIHFRPSKKTGSGSQENPDPNPTLEKKDRIRIRSSKNNPVLYPTFTFD